MASYMNKCKNTLTKIEDIFLFTSDFEFTGNIDPLKPWKFATSVNEFEEVPVE